jgi:ATP-dependent DNA ligase
MLHRRISKTTKSPLRRAQSRATKQPRVKVGFVEPMECLGVATLPDGSDWSYEVKLDGFRLEAVKDKGETMLYSRRGNVLNSKFGYIAEALKKLPDATVLDGEVVALDSERRSDFGLLQNFRSAETKIHYYGFDILVLKGRSLLHAARSKAIDSRRCLAPKRSHHVIGRGSAARSKHSKVY